MLLWTEAINNAIYCRAETWVFAQQSIHQHFSMIDDNDYIYFITKVLTFYRFHQNWRKSLENLSKIQVALREKGLDSSLVYQISMKMSRIFPFLATCILFLSSSSLLLPVLFCFISPSISFYVIAVIVVVLDFCFCIILAIFCCKNLGLDLRITEIGMKFVRLYELKVRLNIF